jgi:hypothetical protein
MLAARDDCANPIVLGNVLCLTVGRHAGCIKRVFGHTFGAFLAAAHNELVRRATFPGHSEVVQMLLLPECLVAPKTSSLDCHQYLADAAL